ncbi:MAG: phosphate-starvation-inducible PsiE family protein [Acidimicrobiales bacterium]
MDERTDPNTHPGTRLDQAMSRLIVGLEYGVVLALWALSAVILIHTFVQFIQHRVDFPELTIQGIDGVLVVIIVLDIAYTVLGQLRSAVMPVRPFLYIGILAGVRDILSASAHLSFGGPLANRDYEHTLVALGVGLGVVFVLVLGLLVLGRSGHQDP